MFRVIKEFVSFCLPTCFLFLQADEVQALSSIYEQEWKVVSESSRIYSVSLTHAGRSIALEVGVS